MFGDVIEEEGRDLAGADRVDESGGKGVDKNMSKVPSVERSKYSYLNVY